MLTLYYVHRNYFGIRQKDGTWKNTVMVRRSSNYHRTKWMGQLHIIILTKNSGNMTAFITLYSRHNLRNLNSLIRRI